MLFQTCVWVEVEFSKSKMTKITTNVMNKPKFRSMFTDNHLRWSWHYVWFLSESFFWVKSFLMKQFIQFPNPDWIICSWIRLLLFIWKCCVMYIPKFKSLFIDIHLGWSWHLSDFWVNHSFESNLFNKSVPIPVWIICSSFWSNWFGS